MDRDVQFTDDVTSSAAVRYVLFRPSTVLQWRVTVRMNTHSPPPACPTATTPPCAFPTPTH
jgi:hypothetical protein